MYSSVVSSSFIRMHARSPLLDPIFARKAGCEMSVSNGTRTASIADQLVIEAGDGSAEFGEPIHYISGVFLITRIVKVDVT